MYKHIIANVVAITLATTVNGLLTIIHLQIDNNKSDKNSVQNTNYQ